MEGFWLSDKLRIRAGIRLSETLFLAEKRQEVFLGEILPEDAVQSRGTGSWAGWSS